MAETFLWDMVPTVENSHLLQRIHDHNQRGESHTTDRCCVCGCARAKAHEVHDGGPAISLCQYFEAIADPHGLFWHHGLAKAGLLHFWWYDETDLDIAPKIEDENYRGWCYCITKYPMTIDRALRARKWRKIK